MRRTLIVSLGLAAVVALSSAMFITYAIPSDAVAVAGGLALGFGIAVMLFGAAVLIRPSYLERAGTSYPVERPSPAPVRSFWARLVARVDEPVPIGA